MRLCLVLSVYIGLAATGACAAAPANPIQPGAGNARAEAIGRQSPLVRDAFDRLVRNVQAMRDERLRGATLQALTDRQSCVAHRANMTPAKEQAILRQLVRASLLNENDGSSIEGGVTAGVFPPVLDEGTACPHVALSFEGAPGSDFQSHHSFPGGLAVHEAFNQQSAENLAALYREIYAVGLRDPIDEDVVAAAPVWHDWAKMLVFQWNANGTEFKEMKFGGLGKDDDFGKPGDSRTGAHHILSLAETMARRLPPLLVLAQASAHAAPTLGNEYKVVNWLRAAAIIAQVDPVAEGYLRKDEDGEFHLPNMRIEYQIDNLSDADFVNSVPAAALADSLLRRIAPLFGYDPASANTYNNRYRNVVLARLSPERIEMVYSNSGIAGVTAEVSKLRQAKVI